MTEEGSVNASMPLLRRGHCDCAVSARTSSKDKKRSLMNGEVLIKFGIGSIQARYGRGERGEQARWRAVAAVLLECGAPPASCPSTSSS